MARVKLTKTTKIALYLLRFYLIFLFLLIVYKFVKVFF
jgi:hypothetical protein